MTTPRRVMHTTFGPLEVDDAGAPIHPPKTTTEHQEETDDGHDDQGEDDSTGA